MPLFCSLPCNIGGNEGIGLSLNRPVNSISSSYQATMRAWGETDYFPMLNTTTPSTLNNTGVSFIGQDKFCMSNQGSNCGGEPGGQDYNFKYGSIIYYISNPGCGTLQAYAQYSHTWSSTSVNGIGVYSNGLSFSWSTTSDHWESSPGNGGEAVTPC